MGDYILYNGNLYSVDELYHYGVPGMKWGVRKSVYKSMDKKQRKAQRAKYRTTDEYKIKRNTAIATLIGGIPAGVLTGAITAKKLNTVPKETIKKGENTINKLRNAKFETDEDKIIRLKNEGKINPKANHIFDQNGNLFMVTWDD